MVGLRQRPVVILRMWQAVWLGVNGMMGWGTSRVDRQKLWF